MKRRVFLLFSMMLFFGFGFFSEGRIAYGVDSSNTNNIETNSGYYFIHYSGGEQKIVFKENVTLSLTGWADNSRSSVNGKIEIRTDSLNKTEDITVNVSNELNELAINENDRILFRLAVSESFKVEDVIPLEFNDQITVVEENENGTSIEEVKTIDEIGTVIQKGMTYYSIDESKQKVVISKEEYYSINSVSVSSTSTDIVSPNNVTPSINYATHVQDIGWLPPVSNGEVSGTFGQAKQLESIKISVGNSQDLGVKYSTHVQDIGWLNYVADNEESGTTGKAKQLEAIKIELTGTQAENFDIYYRVHVQDFGWMDWVKNGELAGTTGKAKRLEAIEIKIIENGSKPPTNNVPGEPIIIVPTVSYKSHVQNYGWTEAVSAGELSGTIDQANIEAIQISLENAPYSGGISYKTHVQNIGWLDSVTGGETSGTTGQNKPIEAIQVNLTGELTEHYDIYYRVYARTFGWLSWAKNGESAGTEGLATPLEAFEIVLIEKGGESPGLTDKPFITKPKVVYSTHVDTYGWLDFVANGTTSAAEGNSKRIEAIKINLQDMLYSGDIIYQTHVQNYGWLNNVSNGELSGTVGQGLQMEAINIRLTGEIANYFDVYYRVHAQDFGWLGWAKNGMKAGSEGLSKRLDAIEIVLLAKGQEAPGSTDKSFLTKPTVIYSSHVENYGWMDFVENGSTSGTNGQAKQLEAIKIDLKDSPYIGNIIYTTHVQDYGWLNDVSNGNVSGTTGQGKRLEAIKLNLTGEIANYYDVYYRVHTQDFGWLGWAKNGMKAGSEGLYKRLEAIEIKLVPKGQGESVNENEAFKKPNVTVFLDPGHGGFDPGAVSGGYRESDLNLAVAKKVQSLLINRGYNVIMSRTNDTYVGLYDRPQMANNANADIFVSIHTNSTGADTTSANGIESYYYKYDSANPSKINGAMHNNPDRISKSIALAGIIQENMVAYSGANDRGTLGNSLAVIRESAMPATLLELGFINNASERQKLFRDDYQNQLAKAIADGIDEFFKVY